MQTPTSEPDPALTPAPAAPGVSRGSRRDLLKTLALTAVAGSTRADDLPAITEDQVSGAEWVSGLRFTGEERALMRNGVEAAARAYEELRSVPLANSVSPAIRFDPEPGAVSGPVPSTSSRAYQSATDYHRQRPPTGG